MEKNYSNNRINLKISNLKSNEENLRVCELEKLGFKFQKKINAEGKLENYLLAPEGWHFQMSNNEFLILDKKGRLRGVFIGYGEVLKPVIKLYTRYVVKAEKVQEDWNFKKPLEKYLIVKDRIKDKAIYRIKEPIIYCDKKVRQEEMAREEIETFMKMNYPGWKNPLRYWPK